MVEGYILSRGGQLMASAHRQFMQLTFDFNVTDL